MPTVSSSAVGEHAYALAPRKKKARTVCTGFTPTPLARSISRAAPSSRARARTALGARTPMGSILTSKGANRLAAVLADKASADADRVGACTLIHTSCYDEGNAKKCLNANVVKSLVGVCRNDPPQSQAEACCALAVLAIHYPTDIVAMRAVPALATLLTAPAVVAGSAAWALSTLAAAGETRGAVHRADIVARLILLVKDGMTDNCRGHAAAALWNLGVDDGIRKEIVAKGAIPPLVKMAHECDDPGVRQRASVALDCLMAYENFNKDWASEKLNDPVIQQVKLAVNAANRELIEKMLAECDTADARVAEDLRLDRIARGEITYDPPAVAAPAPAAGPPDFDVSISEYEPDSDEERWHEGVTEDEKAWKRWEARTNARYDAPPEPPTPDPFAERRTTGPAAELARAAREDAAAGPPPIPLAPRSFRTAGARAWLAQTGFGTKEANPPPSPGAEAPAPAPPEGNADPDAID